MKAKLQKVKTFLSDAITKALSLIKKLKFPKRSEFYRNSITIGIFAVIIIGLAYYIIFPARGFFHSDSTDTIMWAKAMFDAKWIFNSDFNYAAYLPFGGSLLMLPFIPIFGVSMTTQTIGMILFMIVFLLAAIWIFRTFGFAWIWTALFSFVLLFGVAGSDKLREIFYGHVIYYSLGILFFMLMVSMLFYLEKQLPRLEQKIKNTKTWIATILIFLFFMFAATNGVNTITLSTIPVVLGYGLEKYFRKEKFFDKKNKLFFRVFGIIGVASVLGLAINLIILSTITQGYADAYSSYSAPAGWYDNLSRFLEQWFTLYGVNVTQGESMKSFDSLINLIRITSGFFLLIIPFVALFKYFKLEDHKMRVIVLGRVIMTFLLMIGYVFGLLSAASWRLSPLLASSILISLIYLKQLFEKLDTKKIAVVFIVILTFGSSLALFDIVKLPADYNLEYGEDDVYAIANELESLDLTYGYATFWHANAVTVVSDSKVKVRSITADMDKYIYQSESSWYEDQPDTDKYFVLVSDSEYLKAKTQDWYKLDHEEVTFNGQYTSYHVLIFDQNIF